MAQLLESVLKFDNGLSVICGIGDGRTAKDAATGYLVGPEDRIAA